MILVAGFLAVVAPRLWQAPQPRTTPPNQGSWRPVPASPLAPRILSSVEWDGKELLVWGGRSCVGGRCDQRGESFADGAAYDAGTDNWRMLAPSPLRPRSGAAAVWSGREMLIWGGSDGEPLGDGAAYDPATDRWRPLASGPLGGGTGQAVWSGREMLVWKGTGGEPGVAAAAATAAAAYDPASDRWRAVSPGPLAPRSGVSLVWSGKEMLVWGGNAAGQYFSDGAAYDPAADRWRLLSPSPLAGRLVRANWTGREMLIWGGEGSRAALADGAAYDPAADRWRPLAPAPLDARRGFAEVWTGRELLVWGGARAASSSLFGDGAAYDVGTGQWRSVAPSSGRFIPAAYWTGADMLVWGGIVPSSAAGATGVEPAVDGARYSPA